MQSREQADAAYDTQLARLVNSLHALAAEVEQVGNARPRPVGMSSRRVQPNRTILASDVHDRILGWVGQKNSSLTCLMFAAIDAEHVTARGTPAELLDAATTGLQDVGPADPHTEDEHVLLAEAALRGAGVIR